MSLPFSHFLDGATGRVVIAVQVIQLITVVPGQEVSSEEDANAAVAEADVQQN